MPRLMVPALGPKQARRLTWPTTDATVAPGLAGSNTPFGATGAVTNGTTYSEVVNCAGSARLRVRILTATATGTLTVSPVAPQAASSIDEKAVTAAGVVNPTKVTAYATGGASVAVAAGTEVNVDLQLYGDDHVLVSFACTLTGSIVFCDVAQV